MKNKGTLRLKQRDIAILRLLYEHRFLDTELLWYLLKSDSRLPFVEYVQGTDGRSRPITYGFKKQALSKRLKQLFDAGFVNRYYATDQPMGRGFGNPRAIYGLGTKSVSILYEDGDIPVKEVRKIIQGNSVQSPFLRHSLELARFKVTLILACRSLKQKVSLHSWQQGESIKMKISSDDAIMDQEKLIIHPDSYFSLDIKPQKRRHYFLEIDRGTEPIVSRTPRSSIRRKLYGYHRLYQLMRKRNSTINGFQVLFVVPGTIDDAQSLKGRIGNILKELISGTEPYNPKSLVLLTTHESVKLQEPEGLLSSIWYSKCSDESISLIQ